jgi:hypothetical protein
MKKIKLITLSLLLSQLLFAQETKYDPAAIILLDKMSDVLSSLSSVSYEVEASYDKYTYEFGMIKQFVHSDVHMVGPDKMIVNSWGPKGHRQLWYNGDVFGFFDYTEKNYGLVNAPGTIITMIDSIHEFYGIYFPAADFFYPAFTDDLIESSDQIDYVGKATIEGKSCFSILASGKEMDIQIWISNDSYNLPMKYVIVRHKDDRHPQYQATFSNWDLNSDVPSGMFNFSPPPGAHEVRLFSKTDKY